MNTTTNHLKHENMILKNIFNILILSEARTGPDPRAIHQSRYCNTFLFCQ